MLLSAAFKQADGKKIDGRRVLVDVERGRTVNGWLPRRLGGGLGGTRKGGKEVNQTWSGRATQGSDRTEERASGGGDRDRRRDESRGGDRGSDRHERRDREKEDRGERDRRRERSPRKDRDSDRRRDRERSRDRGERDSRRDRGDERR